MLEPLVNPCEGCEDLCYENNDCRHGENIYLAKQKRDKEWIEWIEENFEPLLAGIEAPYDCLAIKLEDWQALKKRLEVKE